LKIPSLSQFTSKQALPWTLGGLAAGGALYFILTGRNTGIGAIDPVLTEIGDLTHLEGFFKNQVPATMKSAPGKSTAVHSTPSTGVGLAPFTTAQPFASSPSEMAQYGLGRAGARQGYDEQALTLQFAGAGELSSFSEDGRLTIA
jgi:hypothetical protein